MFQFPGCPPMTLFCSGHGDGALPPPGFPIRISMDQSPACGSPWLNAACHVLLRQSVPWHSPCALICLIFCIPSAVSLSASGSLPCSQFLSTEPLRSRSAYVCRHIHAPYSLFSFSLALLSLCSFQDAHEDRGANKPRDSSKRYSLREIELLILGRFPYLWMSVHPFCRSRPFGFRFISSNDRPRIWCCISSPMSP